MPLRRLRPGDAIGVAALSGPADPADLARGCAALEAMGYRVRLAANVGLKNGLLGLAGSEAERLAGYRQLLLDPDIAAILFARGGYGISSSAWSQASAAWPCEGSAQPSGRAPPLSSPAASLLNFPQIKWYLPLAVRRVWGAEEDRDV